MAEEIVKVITIDTRKSERSIKDLKDDIKALKKELESTTIGSKEFDLKLNQLGSLQKEYKAINEEIAASSKPVQKQMFELARFGENLAKSYSAINAAMGLLSDGNEDVQKTLAKTAYGIQLIQGLSGFAPMLRDLPKLIDNFKGGFKWLNPINDRINNIASKIAGFSVDKLNALNAPRGGSSSAASSGGSKITDVDPQEINKQATSTSYLTRVTEDLVKKRNELSESIKIQEEKVSSLTKKQDALITAKKQLAETSENLGKQMNGVGSILDGTGKKGAQAVLQQQEIKKQLNDTTKELTQVQSKLNEQKEQLDDTTKALDKYNKKIAESETRLGKFKKFGSTVFSTAIGMAILTAIAMAITALFKWISSIETAAGAQRKLNRAIDEGAASISSKGVVAVKELAKRYRELGDSAEAKRKFLVDFKKEIEETGLAINNINDADNAFINNTDAYIQAIKDRAKAQAIENKAVELYQEYLEKRAKKENKKRGEKREQDKQLAEDLVGAGVMTQEEADMVGETTRLGKKLNKMEDEVEKTLDRLFEEMFELEEKSDPYFQKVEEGAADAAQATADAKKQELETLLQFYNDAERLLMDAKERELLEVNEKYDEQIRLAEKYGKDLTVLEEARLKEIDDIHKKYYDQELADQKARVEEQLDELQQQIERIRQMNDTSNLQEQDQNYITKYRQGIGKAFGAGSTFFYQSAEDVENELIAQGKYNNDVLKLTEDRIKQENALLKQQLEIEGITAERREEIQRTLRENQMAMSNAYIKNEADNIAAYQSLQEKKNAALQNSLSVASEIFGAMATIAGEETKAGKAFAVTQAIIDTYASANSAYSAMAGIPYVGPALGIAAAAAAVASGIANVKTILSTQVSSDLSSVSISSGSVATPPALSTPPIEYTRNLLGNKETDELNKPTKVYVLESDITEVQNRVKVVEDNASF